MHLNPYLIGAVIFLAIMLVLAVFINPNEEKCNNLPPYKVEPTTTISARP